MNMSIRPFLVAVCSGVLAAGVAGVARQGASAALPHWCCPRDFRRTCSPRRWRTPARWHRSARHGVRRIAVCRQGARRRGFERGPQGRSGRGDRQRSRSTQWRRDAERRPLRGDREPAAAVRRHRKAPRRAARAGHGPRRPAEPEVRATRGSSSRSVRTTCCTCRSGLRATSVSRRRWCRRSCG